MRDGIADAYLSGASGGGYQVLNVPVAAQHPRRCPGGQGTRRLFGITEAARSTRMITVVGA